MADAMRTAEYSKEDGPYILPVGYQICTTAELTTLINAKRVNIGSLYFDSTVGRFKIGRGKDVVSAALVMEAAPADITLNTVPISARADTTGTPGNATINSIAGRAAFAAAGASVVITNSKVTANSEIFIQLRGARDATLTEARISAQGAGTFTVTGDAASTGIVQFSFWVVN